MGQFGYIYYIATISLIINSVYLIPAGKHGETNIFSNQKLENMIENLNNYENKSDCFNSELCAGRFFRDLDRVFEKVNEKQAHLQFNFQSNITAENEQLFRSFQPIYSKYNNVARNLCIKFLNGIKFENKTLERLIKLGSMTEYNFKDENDTLKFSLLSNKLEELYANAKICEPGNNVCRSIVPDLEVFFKTNKNYDELLNAWKGLHDETGSKMKNIYFELVDLYDKYAKENGYSDLSEKWIEDFEDPNYEKDIDDLFEQIKPIYQQLHAYVRRKLDKQYSSSYKINHNPKFIQAHLLGNMWGQDWSNIFEYLAPYPDVKDDNITQKLIDNGYTPKKLFKKAEEFFASIGLYQMTPLFWKYSMIERPENRSVQCYASAFDMYSKYDFRIKMCTNVNLEDFFTIHHEMGHIEYYMAYNHLPAIARSSPNSGFHEAVGDAIGLSVFTKKHFKKIGLIDDDKMSPEQSINFLMKFALEKIAFLPFAYLMDKWRWNVFRGNIKKTEYNQKWWEMCQSYQGLESPILRTEDDFDPAFKYHIIAFVPYTRYYFAHLLQFEIYKALCVAANHTGPLHECDFYGSTEAGNKLKRILELGRIEHWSDVLYKLNGQRKLGATALLEYFQPLIDWLKKENEKYPEDVPGW